MSTLPTDAGTAQDLHWCSRCQKYVCWHPLIHTLEVHRPRRTDKHTSWRRVELKEGS
jgi:hypothetical protein